MLQTRLPVLQQGDEIHPARTFLADDVKNFPDCLTHVLQDMYFVKDLAAQGRPHPALGAKAQEPALHREIPQPRWRLHGRHARPVSGKHGLAGCPTGSLPEALNAPHVRMILVDARKAKLYHEQDSG